ncbi:MAG: dihydroorotase [Planctomycetota bacterium]
MTNRAFDLIVRGGTLVSTEGSRRVDVGIRDGVFAEIGDLSGREAARVFSATGLHVLPGVIDTQVHFREPGLTHKEDIESGTRGAVAGGVTAICEMPNTDPPTTTPERLADKLERAARTSWSDYAFFAGAATDNIEHLPEMQRMPGCAGIKIFMGSSTGNLLVAEDEQVRRVLAVASRRCSVHSEDEARLRERLPLREGPQGVHLHPVWRDVETALRSTRRIIAIAEELDRPVHILHITTAEEMELLASHREGGLITVECTPQHLTLAAPDCYDELGTLAQMNPPIREAEHREGLWAGVAKGVVDVIGSDHAPHTREEKARGYPNTPSGMTGVQTLVPIMLDHVARGRLTLERLVELTSANAAKIFGMSDRGYVRPGLRGNLTVVDLSAEREIDDAWIESRVGWTPFRGRRVRGWPVATIIGGAFAMENGRLARVPVEPIAYEGV